MRVENKISNGSGTLPPEYLFHILKWGVFFTLMLFLMNCGLKRPKDEIGPIKEVIGRFERGVMNENRTVLDSVYSKRDVTRDSLISALFLELSPLKLKGAFSFLRRKFSIIEGKKTATAELLIGGTEQKEEKVLEIFLKKEKGEWKIVGQDIK